ncbi:hypothetical protein [Allosediminivita pacifica]|uniref:Flp pilus assembly protein, pilin Flp n=1 Tax=Allosediminivita pacifica TaxID=1267769 RepID=A0A2T6B9N4_9RHOB|nr:hypothetical protein [Allosediminivita pacifica]PTX52738.1 hypothetical protein C8N44_10127 [Allosediminivita pacifica]GGA96240.1 hypothetical protein GCM10011324_03160 [Allosediminivita pacifica]
MKFLNFFRGSSESAMSVDWVVLTAAIVGLLVAGHSTFQNDAAPLFDLTSLAAEAGSVPEN